MSKVRLVKDTTSVPVHYIKIRYACWFEGERLKIKTYEELLS